MGTVRVINEYQFAVDLWDTLSGARIIRGVPPYSVSSRASYTPWPTSNFSVWDGSTVYQIPYTAVDTSIVIASVPGGGGASVAILRDAELAPVPATWDTINRCTMRAINAVPGIQATVAGVTQKCAPNCILPALTTILPLAGSDVINFDCSRGFRLSAWTSDPHFGTPEQLLVAAEHSRYTLVVAPAADPTPGNGSISLVVVTDAAGDAGALLPVLWAAIFLVGLALMHRIIGTALTRIGPVSWLDSSAPSQQRGCLGSLVGAAQELVLWLVRFLGYSSQVIPSAARRKHDKTASVSAVVVNDAEAALSETLLADVQKGEHDGGSHLPPGAVATTPMAQSAGPPLLVSEHQAGASPPATSESSITSASSSTKPGSAGRFASVDALRGLSLCIMIFVNSGGECRAVQDCLG